MIVVIEIPKDSKNKFEIKKDGSLYLDRTLEIALPYNYGYIKDTLASDNDPLDAFVVGIGPLPPGTVLDCDILFGYNCLDHGKYDQKLIMTPSFPPCSYQSINTTVIEQQISFFLKNYKKDFLLLEKLTHDECFQLYLDTKNTLWNVLKRRTK